MLIGVNSSDSLLIKLNGTGVLSFKLTGSIPVLSVAMAVVTLSIPYRYIYDIGNVRLATLGEIEISMPHPISKLLGKQC